MSRNFITPEWVVAYHSEIMRTLGRTSKLMAPEKLESAVMRPRAEAFGVEAHPSLAAKAAALFQGVLIAHAFADGNKRAGVGALLGFLELNGQPAEADEDALYDLVIAVTTGALREVPEIAGRIRLLFTLPE